MGNKDFILKESEIIDVSIQKNDLKIIDKIELEKVEDIVLLTLLTRYIPYEILNRIKDTKEKNIRYVDTNSIYFFLKKNGEIFKFLNCTFEKYKFWDEYLVTLNQKTFAPESLFKIKPYSKKIKKIGYDSVTRLLIPDEKGNYYERNPFNKTIETEFIVRATGDITKLRSYYFTLVKEIIEEKLKDYVSLKFNTLKDFEHFQIESNKSFFAKSIKNLEKDIDAYLIKDIKNGKEIVAQGEQIFIENTKNFKFNMKGVVDIGASFDDLKTWKIFLLNSNTGENLDYDGYREIKKNYNLISNGLYLDNEISLEVSLIRIIEELFIKEQLKEKDISKLHSKSTIFEGIVCIHFKNQKIRKMTILKNGKIEINSSGLFEQTQLQEEFYQLLKKFDLEKDFYKFPNTSYDLKFIKINDKIIYIADTGMRLYFNSTEYLSEYMREKKKGNKGVSRSLKGFLGMSMDIRLNRKEQLYYSFYDTGIKDRETFAPNIKKLISDKKLTAEEYKIFCESLVFKYLSNPARLSAYPFFFKLTSEIWVKLPYWENKYYKPFHPFKERVEIFSYPLLDINIIN